MPKSVILYTYKDDAIKITIDAEFNGEDLVIEGYDIGKKVEQYWGDSDYEYSATIRSEHVAELYAALSVPQGDKDALLLELAKRYHTNTCYSEILKFMDDHKIKYEGFSWF